MFDWWWSMFGNPTALQLKVKQLRETEVSLLEHQSHLEYYKATVPMMKRRIERLKAEINTDTEKEVE